LCKKGRKLTENTQATSKQLSGPNTDFPKQLKSEPEKAVAYKKPVCCSFKYIASLQGHVDDLKTFWACYLITSQ